MPPAAFRERARGGRRPGPARGGREQHDFAFRFLPGLHSPRRAFSGSLVYEAGQSGRLSDDEVVPFRHAAETAEDRDVPEGISPVLFRPVLPVLFVLFPVGETGKVSGLGQALRRKVRGG